MKSKINVGDLLIPCGFSLDFSRVLLLEPFQDNRVPIKESPFLLSGFDSDSTLHNVRVNLLIGQYNISDVSVDIDRNNFTEGRFDKSNLGLWTSISMSVLLEHMLHEALFAYHHFMERNGLKCKYNMVVTQQDWEDYTPVLSMVNDDYVITFRHPALKS